MSDLSRVVLTMEIDFGGTQADETIRKMGDLLPDTDGIFASGFAGIVIRRLVAAGAVSYPNGWAIEGVTVRVLGGG